MTGYRTIIFAILTILSAAIGKHADPELIGNYSDLIVTAVALGFLVLRLLTRTPFGSKSASALAADIGLSPSAIGDLAKGPTTTDLQQAIDALSAATEKVTGHPLMDPEVKGALLALASPLVAVAESSGRSGQPTTDATPVASEAPAPVAAAAPQPATPVAAVPTPPAQ